MPQDSAISSLASLNDDLLFEKVAEGIELLKNNLDRLEESAQLLSKAGDQSSAAILGHIATEEAAKILILLDAIRCPLTEPDARKRTLDRWTNHLWKGIYAEACDWSPVNFEEVCQNLEIDLQWYHLDGPFGVDWIFPNQITSSRERLIYVDYIRDITQKPQDATEWWMSPPGSEFKHISSSCVKTARALCNLGATNIDGLKTIAQIWRPLIPEPELNQTDIDRLIQTTINNLSNHGIANGDWPFDIWNWPFPLWSLDPKSTKKMERLEDLRQERKDELERIAKIEKQRDPPPTISEEQILRMHEAYMEWEAAMNRRESELAQRKNSNSASVILSSEDKNFVYGMSTSEYLRLRNLWRSLDLEEKIALLALAWFSRPIVADWPKIYKDARSGFEHLNEAYCLGYAGKWLEGFRRWRGEQTKRWPLPIS